MLIKESKKQDDNNFSWVSFHDNYEDDDDEALSLCDLPLIHTTDHNQQYSLSNASDKDQELFEFFSDFSSGMRAAEDIIYCGKLLPYSSPEPKTQSNQPRVSTVDEEKRLIEVDFNRKRVFTHREFSSFNELQKSQAKHTLYKNKSFDYHKLQRSSSSKNTSTKNHDGNYKCFRKNVISTPVKTKKQVALFGVMKAPSEMELEDIKHRQNKRNSLTVRPGEKTIYAKNNARRGSWSVLGALGCKGDANTAVAMSLRCIPHV